MHARCYHLSDRILLRAECDVGCIPIKTLLWQTLSWSDSCAPAQLSNIEVAKQQNRLFDAMKAGSEAVKNLQQQVLPRRLTHCVILC